MAATSNIAAGPPQDRGAGLATQLTTYFADTRFVIILEMYDRATEAVYFLPLRLDTALIEQLPERH